MGLIQPRYLGFDFHDPDTRLNSRDDWWSLRNRIKQFHGIKSREDWRDKLIAYCGTKFKKFTKQIDRLGFQETHTHCMFLTGSSPPTYAHESTHSYCPDTFHKFTRTHARKHSALYIVPIGMTRAEGPSKTIRRTWANSVNMHGPTGLGVILRNYCFVLLFRNIYIYSIFTGLILSSSKLLLTILRLYFCCY